MKHPRKLEAGFNTLRHRRIDEEASQYHAGHAKSLRLSDPLKLKKPADQA